MNLGRGKKWIGRCDGKLSHDSLLQTIRSPRARTSIYIVYRQDIGTAAAAMPISSANFSSGSLVCTPLHTHTHTHTYIYTSYFDYTRRGEKRESGGSQPASSGSNPRCRTRKQSYCCHRRPFLRDDNSKRCVSLLYDKKKEGQISILQITRFIISQRARILYFCACSRISKPR
uniref:Uncharacterized protein n=1 Tax=Trichogramma kaykai TaxID=54128 RepID=A0ABD2XPJ2_9HYME